MRTKVTLLSPEILMACTLALSLFATAHVAAQKPKEMTPELQKIRAALDKYQNPVVAIHSCSA